jgi:hypothetical protein
MTGVIEKFFSGGSAQRRLPVRQGRCQGKKAVFGGFFDGCMGKGLGVMAPTPWCRSQGPAGLEIKILFEKFFVFKNFSK